MQTTNLNNVGEAIAYARSFLPEGYSIDIVIDRDESVIALKRDGKDVFFVLWDCKELAERVRCIADAAILWNRRVVQCEA